MDIEGQGKVRGKPPPTQPGSTLNKRKAIPPPESFAAPRRNRGWKMDVEKSETGVRLRVLQPNRSE